MADDGLDPDWPAPTYAPSDDVDTSAPSQRRPGGTLWLIGALVLLICVGLVVLSVTGRDDQVRRAARPAPPASSAPARSSPAGDAPPCGPDEAAALSSALSQVRPDPATHKQWDRNPRSSNYEPCADLSAIVLTVQDGTGSSPDLALMFHRGAFVGTATGQPYPFTELEGPASTGDIVVLTYRTRQSCSTCTDGTLTTVGFQWTGDRVQMLDRPPDPLISPP